MRVLGTFGTLSVFGAMGAMLGGCPIWTGGMTTPPDHDGGPMADVVGQPDTTPTDSGPTDSPVSRPCSTGNDCFSGQYCDPTSHVCVTGTACGPSQSCPTGYFCDARSLCEPGCNAATDCATGQACDTASHRCVAGSQCTLDSQCGATQRCVDGSCRDATRVCQFAYQCAAGQDCVNGACVPHCSPSANTCHGGQTCVNGYCQDPPPSTNSCDTVTCPSGQVCANGTCHAQCTTDGQCNTGGVTGMFCDNGTCRVDDRAQVPFCTPPANGCASGSVCINGACHLSCADPMGMDPNVYCMRQDSSFPTCGTYQSQMVCLTSNEVTPQCARNSDCNASTPTCINGRCN